MALTPAHLQWGQQVEPRKLTAPTGCQQKKLQLEKVSAIPDLGYPSFLLKVPGAFHLSYLVYECPSDSEGRDTKTSNMTHSASLPYTTIASPPYSARKTPHMGCNQFVTGLTFKPDSSESDYFRWIKPLPNFQSLLTPMSKQVLGLFAQALPDSDLVSFSIHCHQHQHWCLLILHSALTSSPWQLHLYQPDSNHQDTIWTSSKCMNCMTQVFKDAIRKPHSYY